MSTFVIRSVHSSDQCPTANSKVRELVQKMGPEMPAVADRLGIKMLAGPYVLGAEHETIAVVEADRVEAVNEFLQATGLMQWNSVKTSLAQHLQDAMGDLDKLPSAPLY
jgi:hypothetical protein